ncbi:MAG: S1C family serine protease [Planctomycetota bacterium]
MKRTLIWLAGFALALPFASALQGQEGEEDRELVSLCRKVRRNVVAITAIREGEGEEEILARFSGVVVDAKGHIVTVADALKDRAPLRVRFLDGRILEARIVGVDVFSGVGVCRVESERLHPVSPGLAESPPVGTRVVAVGNPFGLHHSVSLGIISGTDRTLTRPGKRLLHGFLQTTAPINPGDAGGLLADRRGRFVGMISSTFGRAPSFGRMRRMMEEMFLKMNRDPEFRALLQDITRLFFSGGLGGTPPEELQKKLEELGKKMREEFPGPESPRGKGGRPGAMFGATGINFAIPAHRVLAAAKELIQHGKVVRGRIGVRVVSLEGAVYHRKKFAVPTGVEGVLILSLDEEGPAGAAGVKRFDVIQTFQGEKVTDSVAVMEKVFASEPGSRVKLGLWRKTAGTLEVEVVVAELK